MFVRCSNCQTQFSLDDRQVGSDGVAVRCAVCRYVFRVEPPDGSSAQAWRVETVDGDLFEAEDIPTMRVWIREGRLHPDDTISRTGKHWIRLGDMPEFSDAFAGFPDLPVVLGAPEAAPIESEELSSVGPPPSYAGDDIPTAGSDVVQPMERDHSERLDMSGLFQSADFDRDSADEPDDTTVRGRVNGPSEDTVSVSPGVVSRTSLYEDSASMVLDDLVVPEPEPEPEFRTEPVFEPVPVPGASRRKPKHQTTKVRIVAGLDSADPEASGVLRILDESEEPEVDAVQPAVDSSAEPSGETSGETRRPKISGSMLGAVTAHVKSEPVKAITGPLSSVEGEPEPDVPVVTPPAPSAPVSSELALDSVVVPEPQPPRRSSWPLFAGLGLLCGAAVVFGIPQVRERVLGTSGAASAPDSDPQPVALAQVDAAVSDGTLRELDIAIASAQQAGTEEGLSASARADVALAGAEARAAQAVALRLQAVHGADGSDAASRADDAADAAAQAFADVDVDQADPTRLARTRARVRLAQGRPTDEVLPHVPGDAVELRAMVMGAQLWADANARVPSGLISALSGLENPSVPAQVLLATAYARGGDNVGAAQVRTALETRAADDPTVQALLVAHGGPAVVAKTPTESDSGVAETPAETGAPADGDSGEAPSESGEPDETIIIKDGPKGVSVDKLIERGCEKVEGGDVNGGLKLLLRAFDRRPNDIDVLVCLGTANRKKGISTTALRYFEKALARSPRFMPALLGAARAATKLGEKDKALRFYKRVLGVSPSHAEAKSFVAKQNAAGKKPSPPSDSKKPEPSGGGDTPKKKPEPPSGDRKPEPPSPAP
ncbi:MAG: zinc-ribbon domain-containing protein [Nannocystales bacterium]